MYYLSLYGPQSLGRQPDDGSSSSLKAQSFHGTSSGPLTPQPVPSSGQPQRPQAQATATGRVAGAAQQPCQLGALTLEDLGLLLAGDLAGPETLSLEELSERYESSHPPSTASVPEQDTAKRWNQLEQWVVELQAEVACLREHKQRCERTTGSLLRELLQVRARVQLQGSELRQLQQDVRPAAQAPEKEAPEVELPLSCVLGAAASGPGAQLTPAVQAQSSQGPVVPELGGLQGQVPDPGLGPAHSLLFLLAVLWSPEPDASPGQTVPPTHPGAQPWGGGDGGGRKQWQVRLGDPHLPRVTGVRDTHPGPARKGQVCMCLGGPQRPRKAVGGGRRGPLARPIAPRGCSAPLGFSGVACCVPGWWRSGKP
ncbi:hypothetical protein H8959_010043 [Pygathrix nigripes]